MGMQENPVSRLNHLVENEGKMASRGFLIRPNTMKMRKLHLYKPSFFLNLALWLGLSLGACLPANAQVYPQLKMQKFYGHRGNDTPKALVKSLDGNLLLGGDVAEEDGKPGGCTNVMIYKVTPEGEILWEREIGGSGCDELRDLVVTPDSGVIFVGLTSSFIGHPEKGQDDFKGDYFIGKVTKQGNIEWIKAYGGLDVDQAFAVCEGNGDYVVAGVSNSQNFDVNTSLGMANLWVLKVLPNGEKKTSYVYGGNKADWAYSVIKCANGDFVYAGFTNSEDIDGTQRRTNGDAWIMRTDRYGTRKWQRVYSGKFEDFFTSVKEDKEGRLVVVGNFESEALGKQFWFLKMTPEGKKIYEKIFGLAQDEYAMSIDPTSDGGYIMTGYSHYYAMDNQYVKGGEDFWVIRLDSRGDVIWRQTYGGRDDERGMDVIEYSPGVFYALGSKYNNFELAGQRNKKLDFWLLRIEDRTCEDVEMSVYLSLKNYTAYVNRAFKLKAIVSTGDAFLWDFGDGNTSRDMEPQHKYEMPGVYEVKLTVFLNENCSKTYTVPELIMVW